MLKFFRKSFSRKITFSYLIIFILVSLSGAFFTSHILKEEKISGLKESLLTQARLISKTITASLVQKMERSRIHAIVREYGEETDARITVIDPEGLVLGDSEQPWEKLLKMDNHAGRPEIQTAFQGQTGMSIRYSTTMKTGMLYVAVPLRDKADNIGVLRLALPLGAVERAILSIQRPVFLGMGSGILAVIFLGVLLGGSIARRVQKLKNGAKKFMAGNLTEKISADSSDEFGLLAETMNQMAGTLNERMSEIEEEKNKLAAVLKNMAEAVIAVDCARRVLIVNPAAESIFGVRKEAALGKGLIEEVRSKEIDDMLTRAIADLTFITSEISLFHPVARELRVNAVGISQCEDGVCALLVASDISEMRKLENLRKEFVANVSHELKTPLTSVKGLIEVLQGEAGTDKDRRNNFLKMMEKDADRLARLIDDLLELSKIESGEMPLNLISVDLGAEIREVMSLFSARAKERMITLENRVAEGRHLCVLADRDRLRQILINLIDNAVKFNREEGRVTITANNTENNMVRISVEDTGCGIPDKSVPRIFERFYRVDKARSRELGGTGLGLSIVKHIAESHGGTVSCKSAVGKGALFSFVLPSAPP